MNIDPEFTIDRIAWTAEEFMRLVNDPSLHRSSVILVEEAGVNINRTEWYSFMNKAVSYVSQTYGYKGLVVLFTLPSLQLLDSRVVKLLRGYFETYGIDFNERLVHFTFQLIYTAKKIGIKSRDIYYYRPVIKRKNALGSYIPCLLTSAYARFPNEELRQEYFKRANEYKQILSENLEKEANALGLKRKTFNLQECVEEIIDNDMMSEFTTEKGKWDYTKLMGKYNIGIGKAKVLGTVIEMELDKQGKARPEPQVIPTKTIRRE